MRRQGRGVLIDPFTKLHRRWTVVHVSGHVPGDARQNNTGAKGRGHQLLGAVRELEEDEKVHSSHLVGVFSLTQIRNDPDIYMTSNRRFEP